MKISRPSKIKKTIFITLIVLLAIAFIGVALANHYKVGFFTPKLDDSINLSAPTDDEKRAAIDIKQQSINRETSKTHTGSDPAPDPQPIDGSNKKSVGMEITATNQVESTLHIRTIIKTVTNTGTCSLSLTHATLPAYTTSADVQASSSSSTCKGFDVPIVQLGKGNWKMVLTFSNNELSASTERDIEIQ